MRITVLGLKGQYFEVEKSFFQQHASKLRATVVDSPPPFAAACTDGLLFIYNMMLAPMDVRGGSIALYTDVLEAPDMRDTPLVAAWRQANKPMTVLAALKYFKFPAAEGGQRD